MASGKEANVTGARGRRGNEMPRVSARLMSSRAVMTVSVSRMLEEVEGSVDQNVSVSSAREASSFLSKQGIIATW